MLLAAVTCGIELGGLNADKVKSLPFRNLSCLSVTKIYREGFILKLTPNDNMKGYLIENGVGI